MDPGTPPPSFPTIPGYRIDGLLGVGGVACVYAAWSANLDATVALKVLPLAGDSVEWREQRARFTRERELLGRLRSPRVVALLEYGAVDDFTYIAMEHLPLGTLEAHMSQPLSPVHAAEIARVIAEALVVVHDAGISHRDLKPANVMRREDGSVALIDFGLARPPEADRSALTVAGAALGTPYYASPEQTLGGVTDQRGDLYSLGVIFFEMLAGHRPFDGTTLPAIVRQHLEAPVPRLTGGCAVFQPVVDRLLEKAPDARFASAAALIPALDEAAARIDMQPGCQ